LNTFQFHGCQSAPWVYHPPATQRRRTSEMNKWKEYISQKQEENNFIVGEEGPLESTSQCDAPSSWILHWPAASASAAASSYLPAWSCLRVFVYVYSIGVALFLGRSLFLPKPSCMLKPTLPLYNAPSFL